MRHWLWILAILPLVAFAKGKPKAPPKAKHKDKFTCTSRELELRNCDLQLKSWHLLVTKDKILLDDGVWHSAHDLPMVGDQVSWQKAVLQEISGRTVLQLQIWSPPSGEAQIQELHWFVIELLEKDAKVQVNEVIRRRRPKTPEPPPPPAEATAKPKVRAKSPAAAKPGYIVDPEEKFSLMGVGRKLYWAVGQRRGDL